MKRFIFLVFLVLCVVEVEHVGKQVFMRMKTISNLFGELNFASFCSKITWEKPIDAPSNKSWPRKFETESLLWYA